MNRTFFDELPGILKNLRADALIADHVEAAAGTIAEYAGLPWVTVCNGLPVHREPTVPPFFTPWRYRPDSMGRVRNYIGYAVFDRLTGPIRRVVEQQRRAWGMPCFRHPDDVHSPLLQISQLVSEFDFPRTRIPAHFHYTGPFRRTSRKTIDFPWERLSSGPFIYASMGTLQNRMMPVYCSIAEAAQMVGIQAVISLGGGARVDEVGELPGSPVVVEYAPQMELLKRAGVFLTHGGLNSVLESMLEGVPAVAIPVTSDQGGVAARLQWTGAGAVVSLSKLSSSKLAQVLKRVIADPRIKRNALRLQAALRNSGGVEQAADLVERATACKPRAAAAGASA
jgi:UDP:flavonoid glycosyltransferase YjiC (YdhE family)